MSTERPRVLITGGSRGIGRAVAAELAETHHLVLGGRDPRQLDEVCAGLPSAEPFVVDLADAEATAVAVQGLGPVDVVVHSAGVEASGRIEDLTRQRWQQVLELNVVAVADLTRLLLPGLRERNGLVVLINSGAGLLSTTGNGLYAASKFALRALADALREEERGRVRVSSIHPGRVDTAMQERLQADAGRPYRAEDHMSAETVARAVALAVRTPAEATIESLSIRPSR